MVIHVPLSQMLDQTHTGKWEAVVDRPHPGKIYLHKGVEVEVIACHGIYCWVVEPAEEESSLRPPYTLKAEALEESPLKPGDKVQLHGVMGDRRVHTVIAVNDGMVWHVAGPGQHYVDPATSLRRAVR